MGAGCRAGGTTGKSIGLYHGAVSTPMDDIIDTCVDLSGIFKKFIY